MVSIPVIPGIKVQTGGILNKSIKDIICAVLFGGLGNLLKGNLICIEANINEMLEDAGYANLYDIKDELRLLQDEVKAFNDHLGVSDITDRINNALGEVRYLLSLGGLCPVPIKIPNINGDILDQVTDNVFNNLQGVLSAFGPLLKPKICIDASGKINTGSFNPGSILDNIRKASQNALSAGTSIPASLTSGFKNEIGGIATSIKQARAKELFPDFRHKHNLLTGAPVVAGAPAITIGPRPSDADIAAVAGLTSTSGPEFELAASSFPPAKTPNLTDATKQAQTLVANVANSASYPINSDKNLWARTLGPEVYALALDALNNDDPFVGQTEDVYDYCGRVTGQVTTAITGDIESAGLPDITDADLTQTDTSYNLLWIDAPAQNRVGWAVTGVTEETLVLDEFDCEVLTPALSLNPEIEIFRGKTHLISLPPSNPNVNSLEISNYGYKDNGLTAVRSRILYNLPPGQEFFIYEAKLDSNSNRVPDITKRWSNGLVRFEFSEFLDEANGRNEDFLTWAQAFIPDFIPDPNDINKIIDAEGRLIKSNLIQSPLPDEPGEIWVEDGSIVYDSLTGGTPILIKTWKRAIANLINGENMLIEVDDTFPDYLTYSNEDGSIYGLIKIT